MIQVCGFVPWAYKYTTWAGSGWAAGGKHEPVPTEWRYAEILSCFNAYMDADAIGLSSMANASFFQHYPLKARYPQSPLPTSETLKRRGILDADGRIRSRFYYAHYVGDYDSAAWLYNMLPSVWTDPNRGKVPLSWAFNPNLCARFPLGMAWARETASAEDYFVAGDSGAGYLNPGYLTMPRPLSGFPSGLAAWEKHCARLYEQWGLSLTGFVIDGYARGLGPDGLDAYARFSPDGIVAQKVPPLGVHRGMPFIRMTADLPDDAQAAARAIDSGRHGRGPRFAVYRSILKSPSWYLAVTDDVKRSAGDDAMVVDLYTLLWLVREYETHPDLHRAAPSEFVAADMVEATPDTDGGLSPVSVDDGPVTVREASGSRAWVIASHRPPRYLYFDADDSFSESLASAVVVTVAYLDSGTGVLAVQYDSTDESAPIGGAYKETGRITRTASGAWRMVDLAIPDPRFAGNQNNRSDLRIYSDGDDLAVRRVAVRRAAER
jgi:hypothetical protein